MSTPTPQPDISVLYSKPTTRRTAANDGTGRDRVDLFLPAPGNGSYGVANYIQKIYADAIITAIEEREVLLDLLQNILDDAPNALAAARTYIATRDL